MILRSTLFQLTAIASVETPISDSREIMDPSVQSSYRVIFSDPSVMHQISLDAVIQPHHIEAKVLNHPR